ncbi:MAG: lipid core--O-antigen ligase, partial [Bacteroidota bacterium]|nr:lipid core--O-antigen ligase [Bacteroidota bacterium]
INHVEISWLISVSILLLINDLKKTDPVGKKIFTLIITLWLFVFIHLFAVRTGIITLYLFLLVYFIILLWKNKKQRKFILLLPVLLSVILFVSYKLSDTLKDKLNYTMYDLSQFRINKTESQFYSDSRRMYSIKIGLQLIKENPWFGCGIGNIEDKCNSIYKVNYPHVQTENYYRPHSLYIYVICCFGIFFGTVVLLCYLYPLIYFIQNKNYLFFNVYLSLVIISVWDVILGTLFGECIFLLLTGWGIKMSLHENLTPQQQ